MLSNVSPWYYPPKPPPCTWYFQDPCARHPSSMMAGRTKRMSDLVNYLSIIHLLDMHTMPCTERAGAKLKIKMMDAALSSALHPTLETHSALNIDGGSPVGKQRLCKSIPLRSLPRFGGRDFVQLQPRPRHVVCAAWDGEGAQSPFNYLPKTAINLC